MENRNLQGESEENKRWQTTPSSKCGKFTQRRAAFHRKSWNTARRKRESQNRNFTASCMFRCCSELLMLSTVPPRCTWTELKFPAMSFEPGTINRLA